jgi:hypothetical protein
MIRRCDVDSSRDSLIEMLRKAVQSANLNFIIGAGCSCPGISVLGSIESEIKKLVDAGKSSEAEELIFKFLEPFLELCSKMRSGLMTLPSKRWRITSHSFRPFLESSSQTRTTLCVNKRMYSRPIMISFQKTPLKK